MKNPLVGWGTVLDPVEQAGSVLASLSQSPFTCVQNDVLKATISVIRVHLRQRHVTELFV